MDIKNMLSKELAITKLTGPSLREAIANIYDRLPDNEKRRISREIAHCTIKMLNVSGSTNEYQKAGKSGSLSAAKVLGINHVGLLDITLEWKTAPDGSLELAGYRLDSGGDQINLSKVFGHFNENIALVALTGKKEDEITAEWERNFSDKNIISALVRSAKGNIEAAVYNVVDGETLVGMFGWADALPEGTVKRINQEALTMLDRMHKASRENIWAVFSAGGPIRYNRDIACYASLVKQIKKKYQDKIRLLIDFKFMAGPEESMSVLDINRSTPQDIIKPNVEEFIQVLVSSGTIRAGVLDKNTITEKMIRTYAIKLRERYNLLGVLVSMDKSGLILVMPDRIIREKGIRIIQACPTGSGDSLKAGFVYALSKGKSFEEAVHTGNLFGAATASMEGTETVTPEILAKTETLARAQNVAPEVTYLKNSRGE